MPSLDWQGHLLFLLTTIEDQKKRTVILSTPVHGRTPVLWLIIKTGKVSMLGVMPFIPGELFSFAIEPGDIRPIGVGIHFSIKVKCAPQRRSHTPKIDQPSHKILQRQITAGQLSSLSWQ